MTQTSEEIKILIVDDQPSNLLLLETTLEESYHVLSVNSGTDALKVADSKRQPDLILLDIMMPGMSGYEVLEQLKSSQRTQNIPVILVTALVTEEDELRGLNLGAIDFIRKPYNPHIVLQKVKNQLGFHRQKHFIETLAKDELGCIDQDHKHGIENQRKLEATIIEHVQTIKKNQEQLSLALWGSGNALWDWDLKTGIISRRNDSGNLQLPQRISVHSMDDYDSYIHPRDVSTVKENISAHLAGDSDTFESEYRLRNQQGRWCWVHDQGKITAMDTCGKASRMSGIIKDISERKTLEKKFDTVFTAFRNTSEGIWIANRNLEIEIVNNAFTEITGFEANEVIGKPIVFESIKDQSLTINQQIRDALKRDGKWRGEVWKQGKTHVFYQDLHVDILRDDDEGVDAIQYVGVFSDATHRIIAEEELTKLANYDTLTGLANRALFLDRLKQVVVGRIENVEPFAVLFIDVDNFKRVNDSFGHDEGDQLLKEVANRLTKIQRKHDTVARIGGDEFTALIENITDVHYAAKVAQRMIDSMLVPCGLENNQVLATLSIGIALYPSDGDTVEELIRNADSAMYDAKHNGKNAFRFYTEAMNTNSSRRIYLETELRRSIESKDIQVHYQPKVHLTSGRLCGFEVLARWNCRGETISPEIFITIAEESGMIIPLGELVLRKACAQYKEWLERDFYLGRMAVNLSTVQFLVDDLVPSITRTLNDALLDPAYLELEITEGVILQNTEKAVKHMKRLRDIGISLAMDDFGTGYSSLSNLKLFPINTLKIDRSFIVDMLNSEQNKSIVALIINIAHTLELDVVAEGVETHEQACALRDLQSDEMQGYLFSKPLSAADFEFLLVENPSLYSEEINIPEINKPCKFPDEFT